MERSPYHPAYGLDDTTRLEAVELSKQIGIQKAAEKLNVSPGSIYRWRKQIKIEERTNA
jgi:transposase-like protein